MNNVREFLDYIAISAGMALAISCYAVIGGMLDMSYNATVPLAILLAACICLVVAFAMAELSSMFPSAPGIRTYLKAAFGDKASLLLVFMYLSMIALVAAVESYAFSELVRYLGMDIPRVVVAVGLIALIIAVNLRGVEVAKKFQTASTAVLIISMTGISAYAIFSLIFFSGAVADSPVTTASMDIANLATLMGMAVFLFVGFEWVTPMGKRPQSYQWLVPMSMPLAVTILAVMYILFSIAYLFIAGHSNEIRAIPQVVLGRLLFNDTGAAFMVILSLLAMLTSFNAGLMGAARLVYAIAREGNLPKFCCRISLTSCAPVGAILFLGVLSMAASLVAAYFDVHLVMAVVAAAITALVYGAVVFAVPVLRKKYPDRDRAVRLRLPVSFMWGVGVLFIAIALAAVATAAQKYNIPLLISITIISLLLTQWSRIESQNRPRTVKDTAL